jgi:hypothetical protein
VGKRHKRCIAEILLEESTKAARNRLKECLQKAKIVITDEESREFTYDPLTFQVCVYELSDPGVKYDFIRMGEVYNKAIEPCKYR